MIDLFLSVRHSCNFKILFLFLGKKPQTGENNPSFLKKIKRNFHKAPKSGTISQFPPLNLFTKNLGEVLRSGFLYAVPL